MSKRDYYEVLGVDRGAGKDEIKKTYLKQEYNYEQTLKNIVLAIWLAGSVGLVVT